MRKPEVKLQRKRPRRTAALSKEKILKAAIAEFALKGLDGARVDVVARRSGVNKTLLYHYIGNKDRLFVAALEATYQKIRVRQSSFLARQMDPENGVCQLVHLLMTIWVEHPEYGKLLASENFHGGKHVKRSKLIGEMYQQVVDALNGLLKRGVEQGIFRPGIDAIDLYISISSLSAYYVAHQHTLNALFHVDLMEPRRLQQRENHIIDMILRYVRRSPNQTCESAQSNISLSSDKSKASDPASDNVTP
ncbi:MAG: TetR/AcrR family transcriptional regulator [Pseudolabrys sp.]|nr:TetR/AcrR family transcriptional regulator [Pseudolabrys sp.]